MRSEKEGGVRPVDAEFYELVADYVQRHRKGETIDLTEVRENHSTEWFARFEGVLNEEIEQLKVIQPQEPESPCQAQKESPSQFPALEGQTLDDFRIVREIGRGGMGVVYEAEQVSLERRVAVKVLLSHPNSPEWRDRFRREAKSIAKLKHSGIVPVLTSGEALGFPYFAMERIEGRSLASHVDQLKQHGQNGSGTMIRDSPFGDLKSKSHVGAVVKCVAGVALALQYAHENQIIHRDVKPQNILIGFDGRPYLVDFGIAKNSQDMKPSVTTGVIGTPRYMSPEQISPDRETVDHRTDIYSLGVVLYELLALSPPYRGESLSELCLEIKRNEPEPLRKRNPAVPDDLERICLRAMAKEQDVRYQAAGEMAEDLDRFARAEPIPVALGLRSSSVRRWNRRRAILVGIAVLLLALIAGGSGAVWDALFPSVPVNAEVRLCQVDSAGDFVRWIAGDGEIENGSLMQLRVKLDGEAHLYVWSEDERGNLVALFPASRDEADSLRNPIEGGDSMSPISIPGRDEAWELDHKTGTFEVHIVASRKRSRFHEEQLKGMRQLEFAADPEEAEREQNRIRGELRGFSKKKALGIAGSWTPVGSFEGETVLQFRQVERVEEGS